MKAFRYYGPGEAGIEDMPEPEIGPGEILVNIKACGICGTDIKTFKKGHAKIPPGAVLGHEMVGEIVASETAVFSVGQRVVVAPYAPCLNCPTCQRGHYSLCDNLFAAFPDPGGFAEMLRVPRRIVEQAVIPIPEHLDNATATLTEPLACCLHGLHAIDVQAGDSLLIIGDGPMGLLQALLGREMGASSIILSGVTPQRLQFARGLADVVIDAAATDLSAAVQQAFPDGVDKIMVSVANARLAETAVSLICKGGAINLFAGMPRHTIMPLDMSRLHYDEIKLTGTFGFGPGDFHEALAFLASSKLDVSGFITSYAALADVKEALIAAGRYEGIKTVIV
jgi:L-iditol 2-dehydrogenase